MQGAAVGPEARADAGGHGIQCPCRRTRHLELPDLLSSQSLRDAGDVRLSDLKRALTQAGMASDWEGPGALVAAAGRVRVRLAPQVASATAAAVQPGEGMGCANGASGAGSVAAGKLGGKLSGGTGAAAAAAEHVALMLEGSLCPEYYAVRNLLYGQYHIC